MDTFDGNVDRLIDEPTSWLVVHGHEAAPRCKPYLPSPHVWEVHRSGESEYDDLVLVCVLASWAQWTVDRLASGLIAADGPFATHEEAEAQMIEVAF